MLFSKLSTGVLAIAAAFVGFAAGQCNDGCVASSYNRDPLKDRVLHNTNLYRKEHGAPPLVWNDNLAAYAQEQANTCKFAHNIPLLHSLGQGENLAYGSKTPYLAVKAWGDERAHYSWNNPVFASKTGHFTQLVWKSTTQVGCAARSCKGISGDPKWTQYYIVCRYKVAGNGQNQFTANVLPKSGNYGAGQDPQKDFNGTDGFNDTIPDDPVPGQVVRKDQTWPVPWPKPESAASGVFVNKFALSALVVAGVVGTIVFF